MLWLLPNVAFAGVQIPSGAIKQDSCSLHAKDFTNRNFTYDQNQDIDSSVKSKLMTVGKTVKVGDTIFYADVIRQRKKISYEVVSDIVLKRSFMYTDTLIAKGAKLDLFGTMRNVKTNAIYPLLLDFPGSISQSLGATYAVIKENGFLCSGEVLFAPNGSQFLSENETYQTDPLLRKEIVDWTKEEAIAIDIAKLGDISATLDIKLMRGGVVVQNIEFEINTLSGVFQIEGDLKVKFDKASKSSIKILTIDEPSNYGFWLGQVERTLFKNAN